MCILFIAIAQHPDYPLIVAANRDEYFARASDPMRFWPDHPEILAGRDQQAGGTWLGINKGGQFAAVTNYRESSSFKSDARSRGELVTRFLAEGFQKDGGRNFHQFLESNYRYYNPFNLIYGDKHAVWAWGHAGSSPNKLTAGFHSVSNGPIDQPWPKMSRGVEKLTQYIQDSRSIEPNQLLAIMQDTTQAEFGQLPDTGLDIAREQQLSSIFVRGSEYGTRTTTLIRFSSECIEISECNYDPAGNAAPMNSYVVEP
ncbi:MAG: NRDE family protein [bacterium]